MLVTLACVSVFCVSELRRGLGSGMYDHGVWDVLGRVGLFGSFSRGGGLVGCVVCYVTQLPMGTVRFVGEDWRVGDTWVV